MPAYFEKTVPQQCNHGTCLNPATGVLRNPQNGIIGPRCSKHGPEDAKRMNEATGAGR